MGPRVKPRGPFLDKPAAEEDELDSDDDNLPSAMGRGMDKRAAAKPAPQPTRVRDPVEQGAEEVDSLAGRDACQMMHGRVGPSAQWV